MNQPEHNPLDKKSRMAGIDIVSSILVMLISIAVSLISLQLHRPSGWKSAPGLIPLLFAISLFLMGLGLFISALRNRGVRNLFQMLSDLSPGNVLHGTQTKRTLWILLLAGVYILLLTGRLSFEIAGILFLFSTFTVFWKKGGWLKIFLVSTIVPLAFGFLFRILFSMLLPGDSIFDLFL